MKHGIIIFCLFFEAWRRFSAKRAATCSIWPWYAGRLQYRLARPCIGGAAGAISASSPWNRPLALGQHARILPAHPGGAVRGAYNSCHSPSSSRSACSRTHPMVAPVENAGKIRSVLTKRPIFKPSTHCRRDATVELSWVASASAVCIGRYCEKRSWRKRMDCVKM